MRTLIIISKRNHQYISSLQGSDGWDHCGAFAGLSADDAAVKAARLMAQHARTNPKGGDLMAPEEVMKLIPEFLRSV